MKIELNNGEVLTVYGRQIETTLIKILTDVINKKGRVPTYLEAVGIPALPKDLSIYRTYFGTFNQACRIACNGTKKRIKPNGKKRINNGKWTKERVILVLREYYEENGELPKNGYLITMNKMPSLHTVQKHLGKARAKWLEAILAKTPENK